MQPADDTDLLYAIALAVALALVLAINGAILYATRAFRASRGRAANQVHGTSRVQLVAAGAIALGVSVLMGLGFAFTDMVRDPEPSGAAGLRASLNRTTQRDLKLPEKGGDVLRVQVTGQQWLWRYEYPNGVFAYYELVVPADTAVVLDIRSTDVVHTWWVPDLGGKFDAVPGSVNRAWFKAEREGLYRGRSATLSGPGYAAMRAQVRVVSPAAYKAWLERQEAAIAAAQQAVKQAVEAGTAPGAESTDREGTEGA